MLAAVSSGIGIGNILPGSGGQMLVKAVWARQLATRSEVRRAHARCRGPAPRGPRSGSGGRRISVKSRRLYSLRSSRKPEVLPVLQPAGPEARRSSRKPRRLSGTSARQRSRPAPQGSSSGVGGRTGDSVPSVLDLLLQSSLCFTGDSAPRVHIVMRRRRPPLANFSDVDISDDCISNNCIILL